MSISDVGAINSRRLESPGTDGWAKGVRPDAPDRYLTITIDSHCNEPSNVYELGGIDKKYLDRVPHIEVDDEGRQFFVAEGWDRPTLVKGRPKDTEFEAQWEREDLSSSGLMWSERMEPDDLTRVRAMSTSTADEPGLERLQADMKRDGVDGAVVFANRGTMAFASQDDVFVAAMCHAWNRWAAELYLPHKDRFKAAANLPTGDIDLALKELKWILDAGFETVNISCQPHFGHQGQHPLTYNHPSFDPLWAALEEAEIPVCMHVATGKDPRGASGSGGAIINRATGFLDSIMGPLTALLASGVFARYPKLKFITVEADFGWVPWLLDEIDHAYYKHHMWVRPWSPEPPSHYYRTNCAASFIEDTVGLGLAKEHGLVDNILFSNDYPHQEGTWPHSPEAIERQLQVFSEPEREKILSGNACRLFGFDPQKLRG